MAKQLLNKFKKTPSKKKVDSTQLIQERAYQIWERKGCSQDNSFDNWLEAERELQKESLLK